MLPINSIYFSKADVKIILEYYGCKIKELNTKWKDKIPYNTYRAMLKSEGMVVIEYANGDLRFCDDMGRELMKTCSLNHFHDFFYNLYYKTHGRYIPPKIDLEEANEVAFTNSTNKSSNYSYLSSSDTYRTAIDSDWAVRTSDLESSTNLIYNTCEDMNSRLNTLSETVKELTIEYNKENEKENKPMKGFNFDFGPCTNDNVRMSVYGLAVKNNNDEWVSYNRNTKQIVNVDVLNFDGRKFMYKVPVAISKVVIGDIVIHNKVPMFVTGHDVTGAIITIDVRAGEEKKIYPTVSPFGFNFMTKVISLFNAIDNAPTPEEPFGNLLPFMLMSEDGKSDIDPFMMMMMMQNSNTNLFSNPMMMYFLCGDKMKDNSILPFMMMMNQSGVADTTSSVITLGTSK